MTGMQWFIPTALVVAGAALFVTPRHLTSEANVRNKTMAAIFAEMTRVDGIRSPGSLLLFLVVILSTLVVFFPAVVTMVTPFLPPDWRRAALAIGGGVCVVFAVVAFLVILFSHLSFAWGGTNKPTAPETPFTYIIPLFPALCGLWFIAAAVWPAVARWSRLLPAS